MIEQQANEQRRKAEGGFTLISVMIALVMVTIGLMAVARSQTALYHAQNGSSMRAIAYSIARSYGEDVRGRPQSGIISEGAVTVDAEGDADPNGTYTRSMTVSADSQRLSRVTITVTYPTGIQPVQLVTLIYR